MHLLASVIEIDIASGNDRKYFAVVWEQRKLGAEVEFYSGLTYHPEDVQNNGILVVRSSNIKNHTVVDADNVYVSENVATSEPVKPQDIIVVVRNGSRLIWTGCCKILFQDIMAFVDWITSSCSTVLAPCDGD